MAILFTQMPKNLTPNLKKVSFYNQDRHGHNNCYTDDCNATLTSQTLNADGTPKRPMNAFMIFARRRRPQVSAENQSMRTGEISKILSREWNSMQPVNTFSLLLATPFDNSSVRQAVLPGPSQTIERHVQYKISRLRLPTTTE
jgi:hypothetical protein